MKKRYLFIFMTMLVLFSCKKSTNTLPETGTFALHLTDSPADYDNLYLDIQSIEVNHSSMGWITIGPSSPGIIDILAFNNAFDTLICNADIPVGTITQVKINLGSNNTLIVNGTSKNLIIPSGAQTGLKINVNIGIQSNQTHEHYIDFDAGSSVIQLGNGNYQLIPVLKQFPSNLNGKVVGFALPTSANCYIQLIKGTDTLIAIPENSGYFGFMGVQGSDYFLKVCPTSGAYTDSTLYCPPITGTQLYNYGNINLAP